MKPNSRERQIRKSRKLVTDEQLIAILRAIVYNRSVSPRPLALKCLREHLDRGETLDQIFYDGDDYGYSLNIKRLAGPKLEVEFGCSPGPDVGDGGTWIVELDKGGGVRSVSGTTFWIS